jgi:ABC-2 type transport system ATP-binding protein
VDPVSRRELWAIVDELVNNEGTSVLVSTAYLDEAERCAEVILLHNGRLLSQGKPSEFGRRHHGRVFLVKTPGKGKRDIQERLSEAPGVVDAVIQGDAVRVVTEESADLDPKTLLGGWKGLRVEGAAPRFEDSYVSLLKAEEKSKVAGNGSRLYADLRVKRHRGEGPVITVDKLERRFGDFSAVKNVSFEVGAGEVFGLLGANGAGKTTTFRMLCGLLPASGGRLSVAGRDLRRAAASARERIGYMSQKFSLYGNLSVMENLEFFSSAYGLRGTIRRQRIGWAVRTFDLESLTDAASGELPLGYKQRLALAAALMHEPDILFLDEPTSGVDPMARREFWRHINALARGGVTVLVTTHFMEEAEYCDRTAIMSEGKILALGSPREIKRQAVDAEGTGAATMEDAFIRLIQGERRQ